MANQVYLNWQDVRNLCRAVTEEFLVRRFTRGVEDIKVYGVPRGGIFAALALAAEASHPRYSLPPVRMTNNPKDALFLFDDIVDTGKTLDEHKHHGKPFLALVDKLRGKCPYAGQWVVFPWEELSGESGPQHNVVRMLEYIGEDPAREGLKETPARVVRSWDELFAGYKVDNDGVANLLKTFQDGSTDQMVVVRDIEFFSNCEHHVQPFRGVAHVGYIPDGRIVGLSKLARLVEVYSRRLQVQERLTQQVAQALHEHLKPRGVGVVLEAEHFCMSCRGVRKPGAKTVTSYLEGVFRDGPVRAEFLNLVHNGK